MDQTICDEIKALREDVKKAIVQCLTNVISNHPNPERAKEPEIESQGPHRGEHKI